MMENMCRACMSFEKSQNEFRVMETGLEIDEDKSVPIFQMFSETSTITSYPKDGLPNKICEFCFKELSEAYAFQQKCIKSDNDMRNLFGIKKEDSKNDLKRLLALAEESGQKPKKRRCLIFGKEKPKKEFSCEICKRIFERKDHLSRHLKVHDKKKDKDLMDYECHICGLLFASELAVQKHIISHSDESLKCPYCPRAFDKKISRASHINSHKRKNPELVQNEVKEQNKSNNDLSVSEDNLKQNEYINLKKESMEINLEIMMDDEGMLIQEAFDNNTEQNFEEKKEVEEKGEDDDDNIVIEKPNPHNKKMAEHICTVCDKVFPFPNRLKRHMNVHNPIKKPFECPTCKYRFTYAETLRKHEFLKHELLIIKKKVTRFFKCKECHRKFEKSESLSSHMKTHKKNNPEKLKKFKCELCPKGFEKLHNLQLHLFCHNDTDVCKCISCPKAFMLKEELAEHLSWHESQLKHTCEYCNKKFLRMSTLTDHLTSHTGDRPFLCSECGEKFKTSSNLGRHILRRHNEVTPFNCKECPCSFSCKSDLQAHLRNHFWAKRAGVDWKKEQISKKKKSCIISQKKKIQNNQL